MKNQASNSLFCTLQLIRTPHVGPKTFFSLLKRYGTIEAVIETWPQILKEHFKKEIPLFSREATAREIAQTFEHGAEYIAYSDPCFPPALKTIENAPPLLIVKGNKALLKESMISIVGSRNASYNGQHFATSLSQKLAAEGLVIVSGFARGIDTAAHKGAKDRTVAIMAGGLEKIYPPQNETLYKEILEKGGLFMSEMPMGTAEHPQLFPRRNRLIAGISKGTLVVEAERKSGSLITAEYAALYGRDVFAVPGSPLDPRSKGTNHLLKTGAHFVENHWDILNVLGLQSGPKEKEDEKNSLSVQKESPSLEKEILNALGSVALSLDDLLEALEAPPHAVLSHMSRLESEGRVKRDETNKFVKVLHEDVIS